MADSAAEYQQAAAALQGDWVRDAIGRLVWEIADEVFGEPLLQRDLLFITAVIARDMNTMLMEAVEACRADFVSWDEIGLAIGISRQAASKRFAQWSGARGLTPLRPKPHGRLKCDDLSTRGTTSR